MNLEQFLDTINNNNIQHYGSHEAFTDVAFAVFRAVDQGDTVKVDGCWMNLNFQGPIDYDTIEIKKEDIPKWKLLKGLPPRPTNA